MSDWEDVATGSQWEDVTPSTTDYNHEFDAIGNSGIRGLAGIANFLSPLVGNFSPQGYGSDILDALQGLGAYDPRVKAETPWGKFASGGLEMATNAILPEVGIENTLLAALGAGGARAADLGPWGEAASSILTPLIARGSISGLQKLLGPQTEQGANDVIARLASSFGITPDSIDAALTSNAGDPLLSNKTSAELLQSPQLATLEQSLGSSAGKADMYAADVAARDVARRNLISAISPATGIRDETTGAILQDAWNSAKSNAQDYASSLYGQIPKSETVNTGNLLDDVARYSNQYFGEGAPNIPGDIQGRISYLTDTETPTIEGLQRARSHLLDIARSQEGTQAGSLAGKIGASIASAIDEAPAGSAEWRAANDNYRQFAENYLNGPLKKLPDILASNVFDKILSSPEAAAQAAQNIGDNPEVLGAIKNKVASDLSEMSTAKIANFIRDNKSQLETLLPTKDVQTLNAIQNDIQLANRTKDLANPTRGSNTALKLSGIVQKALTGKDPQAKASLLTNIAKIAAAGGGGAYAVLHHPAIAIPTVIGTGIVGAARDRSSQLVQDALYRALMQPEALQSAMKNATVAAPVAQSIRPGIINTINQQR